jgi:hypothetical protein
MSWPKALRYLKITVLKDDAQLVGSWDNHNRAIEGTRSYEILDIERQTALHNCHKKAQLGECDYLSPPPGKHTEFRTHVCGAVNNGATREELSEVLLQAALYCGMPVGLECFRLAIEVLDELEDRGS